MVEHVVLHGQFKGRFWENCREALTQPAVADKPPVGSLYKHVGVKGH